MTQLPRVNRKNPCPICGNKDWCGFTTDGNAAICMRVSSPKQTGNGGYIHPLNEKTREKVIKKVSLAAVVNHQPVVKRAPEEIDEVYTAFLENLVIAYVHQTDLNRRGLDKYAISLHGYKSMPGAAYRHAICRKLSQKFDLRGIPGFYTKNGNWQFVDYRNAIGYLIPIRNHNHQICALQLKNDNALLLALISWNLIGFSYPAWSGKRSAAISLFIVILALNPPPKYQLLSSTNYRNGTTSGTPAHFATVGKIKRLSDIKSIIVTEGALKANIASDLLNEPVIGLVSVTAFNEQFPILLKQTFPNLSEVKIAFDMDALTNKAVSAQRTRLCETLRAANLKPSILTWESSFKGIDDYLLSRVKSEVKRAA